MKNIINAFNQVVTLSEKAKKDINSITTEKTFPKNTLILEAGQINRHLYFIRQGVVRGFYRKDDKDITGWFAFENESFVSYSSFFLPNTEY